MQENQMYYFLTPSTKVNSKQIKDLNVRPETIKLPEENRQYALCYLSQQYFFEYVSSGKGNKSKNKWDYSKLKSFCSKRNYQQNKRATYLNGRWYLSDKGLISKICKELGGFNIGRINNLRMDLGYTHFSREDIQMANRHMKRFNISNHQGNANQKHGEIPPHTSQSGYYQKDNK